MNWPALLTRRDTVAGLALIVLAIAAASVAAGYPAGGRNTIGSATLPLWAAGIFGVVGLLVLVNALLREVEPLEIGDVKPIAFIALAFLAFALLIANAGLIPAALVAALIAGLAIVEQSWVGRAVTAVVIAATATILFAEILGLPLRLVAWPS
jgi:hypothetical protein